MNINIISVANKERKTDPYFETINQYKDRIQNYYQQTKISCNDVLISPLKISHKEKKVQEETKKLLRYMENDFYILDERGKNFSSHDIYKSIFSTQNDKNFIIGGVDGIDKEFITANKIYPKYISFGRITLPHKLVKLILFEQIYRAFTLFLNHPYHRD